MFHRWSCCKSCCRIPLLAERISRMLEHMKQEQDFDPPSALTPLHAHPFMPSGHAPPSAEHPTPPPRQVQVLQWSFGKFLASSAHWCLARKTDRQPNPLSTLDYFGIKPSRIWIVMGWYSGMAAVGSIHVRAWRPSLELKMQRATCRSRIMMELPDQFQRWTLFISLVVGSTEEEEACTFALRDTEVLACLLPLFPLLSAKHLFNEQDFHRCQTQRHQRFCRFNNNDCLSLSDLFLSMAACKEQTLRFWLGWEVSQISRTILCHILIPTQT